VILYDQLMELCATTKAFYHKDVRWDSGTFRLFSYRAPSFGEFCLPGAIECRGILFEIDALGRPIRVAARPMEKFFNLGENPLTLNVDLSKIARVMDKMDGSLISSYMDNDRLFLKSKASLSSPQALDALDWLSKTENSAFYRAVYELAASNHTVNMEWVAPNNRVVLRYDQPRLVVLNVRHNATGDYLKLKSAWGAFPVLKDHWVDGTCMDRLSEAERARYMPDSVRAMEGIEGFIYSMESGQLIKIKTNWYANLHRAKDQAMNFRAVLQLVLDDKGDDLRQLLEDDPYALKLLDRVEGKIRPWLNDLMADVDAFYAANGKLPRKEYMLKAKAERPELFYLAAVAYDGREPPYREYAMKRYEDLKVFCGVDGFEGLQDE
jgi:RNA ligase